MSIKKSLPRCDVPVAVVETSIFYSSYSFSFHISMGLHSLQWWHRPLAALNHTKVQFLNWLGTICSQCSIPKVGTKGLFTILLQPILGWKPQKSWEQGPPYTQTPQRAVDGAMSLNSGPWGSDLSVSEFMGRFLLVSWAWRTVLLG